MGALTDTFSIKLTQILKVMRGLNVKDKGVHALTLRGGLDKTLESTTLSVVRLKILIKM